MTRRHSGRIVGSALAAALVASPAGATNGYFAHGYSAAQRALGGAGTALAEDALVATINPAGAAWVGRRVDFNLSLFAPTRGYDAGPVGENATNSIVRLREGGLESWNARYFIPGLAWVQPIDEYSSWGLALYGNGGMNSEYHGSSAFFAEGFAVGVGGVNPIDLQTECQGALGGGEPVAGARDDGGFCGNANPNAQVDLMQLFVAPHYARRYGGHTSIGIAPILAGQRFRADGLGAFRQFSNAPDKVSDNGYELSYGYGLRIGVLSGILPGFGLGASYQSRIYMTPFEKYAGLFADEGDFDIPSNWNVGMSVHPSAALRIAIDYQHINYSEIIAVGRPLDGNDFINHCARPRLLASLGLGGSDAPSPACLGSSLGPGFGWNDVNVWKAGLQYRVGGLTLRAGYSKNEQPIGADQVLFNILAPGVVEEHFTAGLAWALTPAWGLDLSGMYAPSNPVRGRNPLSNTTASSADLVLGADSNEGAFGVDADDQEIRLDMHQYEITLGISYRFE